jgi:hypothetical protein
MYSTLIPDEDDIVYFVNNTYCSRYIDMDMDMGTSSIYLVSTRGAES